MSGLATSSSEQLAVMRPAYMSLPSPNITCAEEGETGGHQVEWSSLIGPELSCPLIG